MSRPRRSLVHEHRRAPRRVAVVGDAAWQQAADRLASRFFEAEMESFAENVVRARTWLTGAEAG